VEFTQTNLDQDELLKNLELNKANIRDLEALKKFCNSVLSNINSGGSNIDSEEIDGINRRLKMCEYNIQSCMNKEDKLAIYKLINEHTDNIKNIDSTNAKIQKNMDINNHMVQEANVLLRNLDSLKLEKDDFNCHLKEFKLQNKRIELLEDKIREIATLRKSIEN